MKADDVRNPDVPRLFEGGSMDGQERAIPLGTVAVKLKDEVWRYNYQTMKFELEEIK